MKKALLTPVFLLLMLFMLKKSSAFLFSPQKYYFMHTGLFSDDYFSLIKNDLQQLCSDNYSAQALMSTIKKEFPLVDKINIAYRPNGTYFMVYAHKPLCSINDNFILAFNNETFLKDNFAESVFSSVPHITVMPEYVSKISSLIPPLLRELSLDFYETYNLELHHEHYARLIDKKENNFSIVSSANQKNLPTLLAYCDSVKKNIAERKGFEKKIHWIADVRFNDYIVVYKV